jgi:alpha-tubulin suppressor-like RCC1 family protein
MNKANLIKSLHTLANNTTDLDEIQAISKCIEAINIGTVKLVSTYTDLLNVNTFKGDVYFVENEGRLYYNMGPYWFRITETANLQSWAWGANISGQLGDNTETDRSSPVSVVGGFTDWVQISAGGDHTAAVRANGTAWAWGNNQFGRLGDNTTTSRLSPVSVVGGFTDWVQISAGGSHTTAIRSNGTAWAWGSNLTGQLGDNTVTTKSSPVSVVGGFTDWVQISAGSFHTAAIRG